MCKFVCFQDAKECGKKHFQDHEELGNQGMKGSRVVELCGTQVI